MKLGSFEARGNNFILIFIVCRALGGSIDRNSRAVFALGRNGLKEDVTSVIYLVIILGRFAGVSVQLLEFSTSQKEYDKTLPELRLFQESMI